MTQKILLTIEIDDAALDAAQAKADKLKATLKEIQEIVRQMETRKDTDTDSEAATWTK